MSRNVNAMFTFLASSNVTSTLCTLSMISIASWKVSWHIIQLYVYCETVAAALENNNTHYHASYIIYYFTSVFSLDFNELLNFDKFPLQEFWIMRLRSKWKLTSMSATEVTMTLSVKWRNIARYVEIGGCTTLATTNEI